MVCVSVTLTYNSKNFIYKGSIKNKTATDSSCVIKHHTHLAQAKVTAGVGHAELLKRQHDYLVSCGFFVDEEELEALVRFIDLEHVLRVVGTACIIVANGHEVWVALGVEEICFEIGRGI